MTFQPGDRVINEKGYVDTVESVPGMREYDEWGFSSSSREFLLKNSSWDWQKNWEKIKFDRSRFISGNVGIKSEGIIKKTMGNILDFAKNLTLSSDEKLLRKTGLKDSCGDYTSAARELVMNKLVADNKDYLVDTATALEEESAKSK